MWWIIGAFAIGFGAGVLVTVIVQRVLFELEVGRMFGW